MDPTLAAALFGSAISSAVALVALAIIVRLRMERRERRSDAGRTIKDKHLSPMFGRPISDWQHVFTIRPVHTLDQGWVFCRYVWRRRIYKHQFLPGGGSDYWFQYLVKLQYVYD
ncbi:hypothetical protein SEA_GIANTSBANE_89 [Arthrobacter phage Giantsbane]|nr:hypothetical protein SEA_GIANTSBANE_89 [Arthrobacter phage Giantsbane]